MSLGEADGHRSAGGVARPAISARRERRDRHNLAAHTGIYRFEADSVS